jgi:drug/metabolite transporter (DMT)-like permease
MTSLLSTMCSVVFSFCLWVIKDMIHPTPPDDRMDCLVMDVVLLFMNVPLDFAIAAVLWAFCGFQPRGAWTWQLPLWILSGAAVGLVFFNVFIYATLGVQHLPVFEPLNHGSVVGAIAFGMAWFFRSRYTTSSNQAMERTAGSHGK